MDELYELRVTLFPAWTYSPVFPSQKQTIASATEKFKDSCLPSS